MDEQYKQIIDMLPLNIKSILYSVADKFSCCTTEIRLRTNKPLALTTYNGMVYPYYGGYNLYPTKDNYIVKNSELDETVLKLCNNSIHSHEKELVEGYISLAGGHRVGVCGKIVIKGDNTRWVTDISSVNIRIARAVYGCSQGVLSKIINEKGLLICGPPHSGKTTFLRDYIRNVSNRGERVAVIDCRGEIAASKNGVCGLDVGLNSDVISGGTKPEGIQRALRTMSPDLIAFDEVGSIEELNGIVDCLNSGVRVVTTVHCNNYEELNMRNKYLPILNIGVFGTAVFLDKKFMIKIVRMCDEIDKDYWNNYNNNFILGNRYN